MLFFWSIIAFAGLTLLLLDYKEAPVFIKPVIVFHIILLLFLMAVSKVV